ncbi:MAG: thioredoxin family protein, partial [Calditrichaeota bacterium]|nr:thioredoxin family protein [Calditrichota bacterium]
MTFIHDQDRINIEKRFQDLDQPVRILNFSQEMECNYCKETRQLLEELAALSDKITLEVYDLIKDQAVAEQFGIDKLPATVVMGEKDYGIRLYGIPSGFEFSTLLEDI